MEQGCPTACDSREDAQAPLQRKQQPMLSTGGQIQTQMDAKNGIRKPAAALQCKTEQKFAPSISAPKTFQLVSTAEAEV